MSGQWTGGSLNRIWQHPGSRARHVAGDDQRSPRLAAQLATAPFWCEVCGASHPLSEHRECRAEQRAGTR